MKRTFSKLKRLLTIKEVIDIKVKKYFWRQLIQKLRGKDNDVKGLKIKEKKKELSFIYFI